MKPSECLKKLLDKNNVNAYVGICNNFLHTYGDSLRTVMETHDISFEDWPLYSGWTGYPVPYSSSLSTTVEFNAYEAYGMIGRKWDKRTKYGSNRYKLLVWLIEQFESKGA